eukprot:jgi/Mesen1/657/ME000109S10879
MGLGQDFWEIIRSQASVDPTVAGLSALRGKKVAVDLSYWICQLDGTKLKKVAQLHGRGSRFHSRMKPHLRNLFFRVVKLVARPSISSKEEKKGGAEVKERPRVGALPVFVVDGRPPVIKLRARLERFYRLEGVPFTPADIDEALAAGAGASGERNGAFRKKVEECVVVLDAECRALGRKGGLDYALHGRMTAAASQGSIRWPRLQLFQMELLELMGMPVLRAHGEAEALCAQLDCTRAVDACVTPDSDAFLHGARTVIKQAECWTTLEGRVATHGECPWTFNGMLPGLCEKTAALVQHPMVEMYRVADIESQLGLTRRHLVALALLLGCDYNSKGVGGIGKAAAIRLVRAFPGDEILDRLRGWGGGELPSPAEMRRSSGTHLPAGTAEEDDEDNNYGGAAEMGCGPCPSQHPGGESQGQSRRPGGKRPPHCGNCGHPGKVNEHRGHGCALCSASDEGGGAGGEGGGGGCRKKVKGFACACSWCARDGKECARRKEAAWWQKLCSLMAATRDFPDERIVTTYLVSSAASRLAGTPFSSTAEARGATLTWQAPDMPGLEDFLSEHLNFGPIYTRQKALPLLSHFCLTERAAKLWKLGGAGPALSRGSLDHDDACAINGQYVPSQIVRTKKDCGEMLYRLRWQAVGGAEREVADADWLGVRASLLVAKAREEMMRKGSVVIVVHGAAGEEGRLVARRWEAGPDGEAEEEKGKEVGQVEEAEAEGEGEGEAKAEAEEEEEDGEGEGEDGDEEEEDKGYEEAEARTAGRGHQQRGWMKTSPSSMDLELVTDESMELVRRACPEIARQFEDEQAAKELQKQEREMRKKRKAREQGPSPAQRSLLSYFQAAKVPTNSKRQRQLSASSGPATTANAAGNVRAEAAAAFQAMPERRRMGITAVTSLTYPTYPAHRMTTSLSLSAAAPLWPLMPMGATWRAKHGAQWLPLTLVCVKTQEVAQIELCWVGTLGALALAAVIVGAEAATAAAIPWASATGQKLQKGSGRAGGGIPRQDAGARKTSRSATAAKAADFGRAQLKIDDLFGRPRKARIAIVSADTGWPAS